jgi:murein DD-endopeptidase MepM/ murein hydrolase activator NlpD
MRRPGMRRIVRRDVLLGGMSLAALAASGALARAEGDLRGQFTQGALIRGRTTPGAQVSIDGKTLSLSSKGDFAFGFAYDRTTSATLRVAVPGGETETKTFDIAKREYNVQRIDGLPEAMVEPPTSVMKRIERDNHLIGAARARDTEEDWFAEEFVWPVKGPITGVFGSQRILNGVPKRPHFGTDIAAGEGTPIHAPLGSIVAMAEHDMYFTGGTVILDHGHGVSTSYLHMSRLDVKVGDRLAKGDPVGAIGHTGRATGPHLCWRLNWFQERLDAALVVPPMA